MRCALADDRASHAHPGVCRQKLKFDSCPADILFTCIDANPAGKGKGAGFLGEVGCVAVDLLPA